MLPFVGTKIEHDQLGEREGLNKKVLNYSLRINSPVWFVWEKEGLRRLDMQGNLKRLVISYEN